MDPILHVGGVAVYRVGDELQWLGPLAVDADGAPNAYGPPGTAHLDALGNAGHDGNWWGVVTDTGTPSGRPVVQGADDPCPGFYVSPTALADHTRHARDPLGYVDASTVPYLSIPPDLRALGARLGDVALVSFNGTSVAAICADVGPHGKLGEGSVALARALGLDPSPRHGGTDKCVVSVRLFLNSRRDPAWPRTVEDIAAQVASLTAPVPRDALS